MPAEPRREQAAALGAERRVLRTERARVQRWRRLVRGRIDLAVAAIAPPDPIGIDPGLLGLPAARDAPDHRSLVHALRLADAAQEAGELSALRTLDDQMVAYLARLDAAIDAATDAQVQVLVRGLAVLPPRAGGGPSGTAHGPVLPGWGRLGRGQG